MRKLLTIILILALNIQANETTAVWGHNDIVELIKSNDSFMSVNAPLEPKSIKVVITAYSSTPDQTDDTPFITASNTRVRDGIVAANFLAFGTRVQIPEIFGDKVFTVEDRMAKRHSDKMDIWFPERHLAKKFGIREADVIVLQ